MRYFVMLNNASGVPLPLLEKHDPEKCCDPVAMFESYDDAAGAGETNPLGMVYGYKPYEWID